MRKTALLLLAALAAILVLAACQKSVPAPLSSYITDDGDYLSAEQENALQSAILEAREKTESDYIIVFTKNPPTDDSRAAAEQVMEAFRNAGGGYGENQQTIGLYVDMLNRKLFINEYNKAEDYKLSEARSTRSFRMLRSTCPRTITTARRRPLWMTPTMRPSPASSRRSGDSSYRRWPAAARFPASLSESIRDSLRRRSVTM